MLQFHLLECRLFQRRSHRITFSVWTGTDYAIYVDGEFPEVGNYLKNEWEQPGRVTKVHAAQDGQEQISVRWHDGGITLLFANAAKFTCSPGKMRELSDIALEIKREQRAILFVITLHIGAEDY
jgi:hypothetical protein